MGSAQTVDAASGDETAASVGSRPRIRRASVLPSGTHVGRYQLVDRLGAGGMGVVYRARDPKLDRDVAVKLVAALGLTDAQARLEREAQAMAKLSHPNVCTVHDIGTHDDQLFIAMELCTGGTLTAWLRERRPWRDIVGKLVAAGRGLAAAHQLGIVHRDFKPDNVMLTGDGLVKVSDFGLARSMREDSAIEGTPAYMSPEQLAGGDVDARSDQFAFAVSLWQGLFGALPFQPDPAGDDPFDRMLRAIRARRKVRATDARAPARVVRIVERALEPAPGDRWPTLAAMLDALERAARSRVRRAIVAALVFAMMSLAVFTYVHDQPRDPLFPLVDGRILNVVHDTDSGDTPFDPVKRLDAYMHTYRITRDPAYLRFAVELKIADEVSAIDDKLTCDGLALLDQYEALGLRVDDITRRDAAKVRVRCAQAPWLQIDDLDELEETADQAMRDGDFHIAINSLLHIVRSRPERVELWKRIGDEYVDLGWCHHADIAYRHFSEHADAAWKQSAAATLAACDQNDDEDPNLDATPR